MGETDELFLDTLQPLHEVRALPEKGDALHNLLEAL